MVHIIVKVHLGTLFRIAYMADAKQAYNSHQSEGIIHRDEAGPY